MSSRLLLLLSVVVILVSGGLIFAQQVPRAPQAPSAPASPPKSAVPAMPDAPPAPPVVAQNFTFVTSGGNFLGIFPEEVDKENMSRFGLREPQGVAVNRVAEGSPAERAGLKKDDVILRFDNEPVTTVRKLNRLVTEAAAGQTVRLTISRGGSEQEVAVTLGKREGGGAAPRVFNMIPRVGGEWNAPAAPGQPKSFVYSFGASRRIGLSMMPLTKQLADYFGVASGHGLLVTNVSQDGPAARAGIKAGDVITMVDGKEAVGAFDLLRVLGNKDQTDVNLTIIRDKSQQTIRVTPERGSDTPSSLLPEMGFPPEVGEMESLEMNLPPLPQMDVLLPRVETDLQNLELPALQMEKMPLPKGVKPKVNLMNPFPPIL